MRSFFGNLIGRFRGQNAEKKEEEKGEAEGEEIQSPIEGKSSFYPSHSPFDSADLQRTPKGFTYRVVKKRKSITPDEFRSGSTMLTENSFSSVFGTPRSAAAPTKAQDEASKTEIDIDIENSPMPEKSPQFDVIITKPKGFTNEGEYEKRAAMEQLSRLKKLRNLPVSFRNQVFALFARKLDQYNKKKAERENVVEDTKSLLQELPAYEEVERLIGEMQNEKTKWSQLAIPIHDQLMIPKKGNQMMQLNINISTELCDEFLLSLDIVSKRLQTFDALYQQINENSKELALVLSELAKSNADPVAIAMSTKN